MLGCKLANRHLVQTWSFVPANSPPPTTRTIRYIAVAEKACPALGQERPIVTVYDLATKPPRKRRACVYLDPCDSLTCEAVAFDGGASAGGGSSACKHMLTLYGRGSSGMHDWTLVHWVWDKGRPTAVARVSVPTGHFGEITDTSGGVPGGGLLRSVSFNPLDSSTVCVSGEGVFKFLKLQEADGTFRTIPYQLGKLGKKIEETDFVSQCWLTDDRLLVGTHKGELLLLDNTGEFICVVNPPSAEDLAKNSQAHDDDDEDGEGKPTPKQVPGGVQSIVAFSRGFVAGGDVPKRQNLMSTQVVVPGQQPMEGLLRVYEKTDEKSFHLAKEIRLPMGGIRSITVSL